MKADVNGRNQEAVQSVLHEIISRKNQQYILLTPSLHDNIESEKAARMFYRRIISQKKQQYESMFIYHQRFYSVVRLTFNDLMVHSYLV